MCHEALARRTSARAQLVELRSILAAQARECKGWQVGWQVAGCMPGFARPGSDPPSWLQDRHTSLMSRLKKMHVRELLLPPSAFLAGHAPCELGLVSGLQLREGRKVSPARSP